jgi:hypothetical protein
MRDVYPHYAILETTERTIPVEQHRKDPFIKEDVGYATPQERRNIWLALIGLVVLLALFAYGGSIAVKASLGK